MNANFREIVGAIRGGRELEGSKVFNLEMQGILDLMFLDLKVLKLLSIWD